MDKDKKMILGIILTVTLVGGFVIAMAEVSNSYTNDYNEYKQKWKDRSERELKSKGYSDIRITSCTPLINEDSAMTIGSFTSKGSYHTFTINFVWEDGRWKLYDVYVF